MKIDGGFHFLGIPQNRWLIVENPIKPPDGFHSVSD